MTSTWLPTYLKLDDAATIAEAFAMRCALTPEAYAYREFDAASKTWKQYRWKHISEKVGYFQSGLQAEGIETGSRIAIMLKNSVDWVVADQAAYVQGLVPVPLFVDDRPDNVAYIINDADIKLIVIDGEEHWARLKTVVDQLGPLKRILTIKPVVDDAEPRLKFIGDWLPATIKPVERKSIQATELATVVYTSGTTGRPKGVMLSHRNILSNAQSGLRAFRIYPDDIFLSFLPLSHTFERTCDYYLNMISGASIVFSRSVPQLAEDFRIVKPTLLFSVPRIYERFYTAINDQLQSASPLKQKLFNFAVETGWNMFEHQNGRGSWKPSFLLWPLLKKLVADKLMARFGGRLRLAISGGAALSPAVAKVFIGLGLPICQGYGLTEASPLLTVNLLEKNDPATVGLAVPDVELKLGENNALLAKGPNIMLGFWNNPQATADVMTDDGWLKTGDQARIDEHGFVHIIGRTKDIIVLANGEKISPVDMELAIQLDPLFEQVLIYGESRPYLTAIAVLNDEQLARFKRENQLDASASSDPATEKLLVKRIAKLISAFPGYAQVRRITIAPEKWTVDNGMMTSTLKLKRAVILQKYEQAVDAMYKGHG